MKLLLLPLAIGLVCVCFPLNVTFAADEPHLKFYPIYHTDDFFSERYTSTDPETRMNPAVKAKITKRVKTIRELAIKYCEEITVPGNYKCEKGYDALKALALMQALPYLTAEANRRLEPGINASVLKDNFTKCKKAAETKLTTIAGFYKDVKKNDEKDAPNSIYQDPNYKKFLVYSSCMFLMCLEYYYAGGLNIEYESKALMDRGFTPNFIPGKEDQPMIARLTATLLCSTTTTGFDKNLAEGSIWNYNTFGASGGATCAHKSGFGMMGLRAAINMGVLDFEPAAFDFKIPGHTGNVGKQVFIERLSDVLIHCVMATFDAPKNASVPNIEKNRMGVVGWKNYVNFYTPPNEPFYTNYKNSIDTRYAPRLRQEANAQVKRDLEKSRDDEKKSVDNFRTSIPVFHKYLKDIGEYKVADILAEYMYEKKGISIAFPPSQENSIPQQDVDYAFFRYTANHDYVKNMTVYGTYYTACAAYVLSTASNTLPLVFDRLEKYKNNSWYIPKYPVTKAENKWTVGSATTLTFDESLPYVALQVDGKPVSKRIQECLNFCQRVMTSEDTDKMRRTIKNIKPKDKANWLESISFYGRNGCIALHFYGFFKLGMSIGEPDYFETWPYYEEMCDYLCAEVEGGNKIYSINSGAFPEFVILTLTGAFRPLWGRDTPPDSSSP